MCYSGPLLLIARYALRKANVALSVIIAAAIACAACNDKKESNGGSSVCDANTTVDCGDVPRDDVGGERFVAGLGTATCAGDGSGWDTSACTQIAGGAELSNCTGPGQGDCDSGLSCVSTGTNVAQCLLACDANGACPASHVCVTWSEDGSEKYCFATATTGDQCYATVQCTATGDECQPTAIDNGTNGVRKVYGACGRSCTGAEIGRAGGTNGSNCNATETCAANPLFFEYQKSVSNNVTCNADASTDTCDIANGYHCEADVPAEGTDTCVRYSGNCLPSILPLLASITQIDESSEAVGNDDYTSTCFVPLGGNTDGYLGEIYLGGYGCGLTAVTGVPADVICARYPLAEDTDLTFFGYCVGFCAGPNDTILDCGSGYHCDRLAIADALYIEPQLNAGARVTCTGSNDTTTCDVSGGYSCVTIASEANVCARSQLLCLKN